MTTKEYARLMQERPSKREVVLPHTKGRIKDVPAEEAQRILSLLGVKGPIPWKR